MDWKKKLTSRKLWTAVASFAALLILAFGGNQSQATQITAIIMAGATVVAYIVGEGLVDAAAVNSADTSAAAKGLAPVIGTVVNSAPAEPAKMAQAEAVGVKQETAISENK